MTLPKRIILGLFFVFTVSSFYIHAQENKVFTLNELIPGGDEYARFSPHIPTSYQWYGNRLMMIRNDSVWEVTDPAEIDKKKFQFTFSDIGSDPLTSIPQVVGIVFSPTGKSFAKLYTGNGIVTYEPENNKLLTFFKYPEQGENHELSPSGRHMAFTRDHNLFLLHSNGREEAITQDSVKGVVNGESVHRNEFGIDGGIFWSPDGNQVAFYRMDEQMVSEYPLVDASARVAELKPERYPMAGMSSHKVTVGVYDTRNGQTVWLKTGEPGDQYLTNIAWNPTGEAIYIAQINRGQDTMQLSRYNSRSGERERILFTETSTKYVEPENPPLFVRGQNDRFIWQSERSGYNHLYLYNTSGEMLKQLTEGNWEVTEVVGFDERGENLFFISTLPSPIDRHICSVNLKSGLIKQHTTLQGMHSAELSDSGRYLIDRYTAHNTPGKIDLIDSRTGRITQLTAAKDPFAGYRIPSVSVGSIKAADGVSDLWYRMVKPADFDQTKKYPVVVYVYGGPHSQMVSNRWRYGSGGWETYMAQKGYIVFVMDNRGTAYRGLNFEQATFRQLGNVESEDQMKGVEYLRSLPYVDSNRMGIHGWSYGGFMTINMLLRYPGVFKAGVAGGPVIDWKYYEVMYGERYMDTPQENPEGYRESSLINKAGNLKERLLIIHGDQDPVVVMQHSIQFIRASIDAGTHPDLFIYPGHGHNMMGRDRVHLHEHITRYFDDFIGSPNE